jgi:hypothetical protein
MLFFKMRTHLAFAISIACAFIGLKFACASDLALVHARVYASPGAPAIDDATIVIHNDRVTAVRATSAPAVSIAADAANGRIAGDADALGIHDRL